MPNTPLRLFQITDTSTKKPVPALFFSDKKSAKLHRSKLNEEAGELLRYVVSPGPDHHNYRS